MQTVQTATPSGYTQPTNLELREALYYLAAKVQDVCRRCDGQIEDPNEVLALLREGASLRKAAYYANELLYGPQFAEREMKEGVTK